MSDFDDDGPPPKPCRLPTHLWFVRRWVLGIVALVVATVLVAALGSIASYAARVVLVLLVAVPTVLFVYWQFISLLSYVIANYNVCTTLAPGYIVYVLAALQVAQAHVYFAVFTVDDTAFVGVTETYETAFRAMLRLFYFSSVTFVSVGYGDISPASVVATLAVLPQLWTPIFYLGLLLGRIAAGGEAGAVQ